MTTFQEQRAALDANRVRLFAVTWGAWEVYYGGYDTPADRVPTWAVWDNPIDDDGLAIFAAGGGFQLNSPKPGIMSVDRSEPELDPLGRINSTWGSVISRRDEYLRQADGLTLEFKTLIRPPTPDVAGWMAYHRNSLGVCYGLHLGPNIIKGAGYGTSAAAMPPATTSSKEFNTTDKPHIYRMCLPHTGLVWKCYVDGKFLFDATANKIRVTSLSAADKFATTILGGEKGNRSTSFELDYVGYRRGNFPPGVPMPPPRKRTPPPLPKNMVPGVLRENWKDLHALPVKHYPVHKPNDLTYPFEFVSAKPGYRTVDVDIGAHVPNKGNMSVEWELQVRPNCEWRGFMMMIRDGMGSVGMLWSPDRVELTMGLKNTGHYRDIPIGIRRVMMNTTDKPHKYRLVRHANTFYWHLYVDDNPIPALYDQHCDASQSTRPYLRFGDTGNNWGMGFVSITGLRVSPSPYAPPIKE